MRADTSLGEVEEGKKGWLGQWSGTYVVVIGPRVARMVIAWVLGRFAARNSGKSTGKTKWHRAGGVPTFSPPFFTRQVGMDRTRGVHYFALIARTRGQPEARPRIITSPRKNGKYHAYPDHRATPIMNLTRHLVYYGVLTTSCIFSIDSPRP